MNEATVGFTHLLEMVGMHIDIPESFYRKAALRHRSVGAWLNRPHSTLARFSPDVRPQGSFRYGTVIRPLDPTQDYDLDNVCQLNGVRTTDLTQEQLKAAYGVELRSYAQGQGIVAPLEEHNRCWRLRYADEAGFHLDSLPCLTASGEALQELLKFGVQDRFANPVAAITDKRHPQYRVISMNWLQSNPRGFARWFESRAGLGRERVPNITTLRATVEEVPAYEWKTTLQRSIQLLKRHRDVMFRSAPDLAPISMIITNLAARAYGGERDLASALISIVESMLRHISPTAPRIANPTLPTEDYADKWRRDPRLETQFRLWHTQLQADIKRLERALLTGTAATIADQIFSVSLRETEAQILVEKFARPMTVSAPTIISSGLKPWGT